jgi:hypothetical protein
MPKATFIDACVAQSAEMPNKADWQSMPCQRKRTKFRDFSGKFTTRLQDVLRPVVGPAGDGRRRRPSAN